MKFFQSCLISRHNQHQTFLKKTSNKRSFPLVFWGNALKWPACKVNMTRCYSQKTRVSLMMLKIFSLLTSISMPSHPSSKLKPKTHLPCGYFLDRKTFSFKFRIVAIKRILINPGLTFFHLKNEKVLCLSWSCSSFFSFLSPC